MAAIGDSYIEPRAYVWDAVDIFGLPYTHYGSVNENKYFTSQDTLFGSIYVHYGSYHCGIEKLPPAETIKSGVRYGFNGSMTGSLSVSTEQWS